MMEKIDINNTGVVDGIRNKMAVATTDNKGLLDAKSVRFIKSGGLHVSEREACIKLYSAHGQSSVAAIISSGRVEAGPCGVYVLAFTIATVGSFACNVSKINNATAARFYYTKDGNKISIYVVSNVDYSITNISPLVEYGAFTYHLTKDTLPEGAIEIAIS